MGGYAAGRPVHYGVVVHYDIVEAIYKRG
jgi:hypothetical protein